MMTNASMLLDINRMSCFPFLPQMEKDVFSSAYEKYVDIEHRKENAQFFTHKEIVQFIFDNLPIKKNSTILDPTCGAAAFLQEAIIRGYNVNNLYGIDIDPIAIDLAKKCVSQMGEILFPKIVCADTINTFALDFFPEIKKQGGFDFIVGNPPFMPYQNYSRAEYSEFISGNVNSATLLIAKSLRLLKADGYLAFVLPKNILRVDSFYPLRQYLSHNTTILSIYDIDHYFKDVRGDQILLFLKKSVPDKKHKIKIQIIKKEASFQNPDVYYLYQKDFQDVDFYPVYSSQKIYPLAEKLLSIPQSLNSQDVEIYRGIPISEINENNEGKITFVRGKSLGRFCIKKSIQGSFKKKDLTALNERLKKQQKDRLIFQNLCSKEGGLCGTLVSKDIISLDTVTNISSDKINLKYLLALLTSKLANFFVTQIIFLNSNFTMHTDKVYIGKFPFVEGTSQQQREIILLTDALLQCSDKYSDEYFNIYDKLNKCIYDIYGLSDEERTIINKVLQKTMSRRSYGCI